MYEFEKISGKRQPSTRRSEKGNVEKLSFGGKLFAENKFLSLNSQGNDISQQNRLQLKKKLLNFA